jgi:hypothetical protein
MTSILALAASFDHGRLTQMLGRMSKAYRLPAICEPL